MKENYYIAAYSINYIFGQYSSLALDLKISSLISLLIKNTILSPFNLSDSLI